jgi:hypothetical protein
MLFSCFCFIEMRTFKNRKSKDGIQKVIYEVLTTGTVAIGCWNKLVSLKATWYAQNTVDNVYVTRWKLQLWLLWHYSGYIQMHQHETLLDFIFSVCADIGKMTPLPKHSKFLAWDFAAGPWTGNLYQKTTKTWTLWKRYYLYCIYILIQ